LGANMAPNLAKSKRKMIRHMIVAGSLTKDQIAKVAGCRNLRCFGNTHAPHNGGGRRRSIDPVMCDAICQYLL
jgi:hypothetical protein